MNDHDPYDKDFDFEKVGDEWPAESSSRKFSLKYNGFAWIIGLSCLSLSGLAFFLSGGHPITVLGSLFQIKPSEEELLRQDAERIKKAVVFFRGENVIYSVHRYTDATMWDPYYGNAEIMNARGNSFVETSTGYYYISDDKKRLYKCLIDEPERVHRVSPDPAPRSKAKSAPVPKPLPEQRYEYVDEFYQDSDGTYKNRKILSPITQGIGKAGTRKNINAEEQQEYKKGRFPKPSIKCNGGFSFNSPEGKIFHADIMIARTYLAKYWVKYLPDGEKDCQSNICTIVEQSIIEEVKKQFKEIVEGKEFFAPYREGHIFVSSGGNFYFLYNLVCGEIVRKRRQENVENIDELIEKTLRKEVEKKY